MPEISSSVFQPPQPTLIAELLHRLRNASGSQPCGANCSLRRIPSSARLLSGQLKMEAQLVLHPDEVEAIFTVSLDELMSPQTIQKVLWTREGREYEVPVFAVQGPPPREIWGATAAMTASLLARLGWEPRGITRVEDRPL